jgi:hypothetical protein
MNKLRQNVVEYIFYSILLSFTILYTYFMVRFQSISLWLRINLVILLPQISYTFFIGYLAFRPYVIHV